MRNTQKTKIGRNYRPQKPQFCPDLARDAAAHLIVRVFDGKDTLDDAMLKEKSFSSLKGRDRGFAAAVAKDTIRYIGQIDILINHYLQKPLPDTAGYIKALLRTAVGQHLGKIAPDHAIIDRAVALAKTNRESYSMSGLANAILRKIFRNEDNPEISDGDLLPQVWRSRYIANYGVENTDKIASCLKTHAPIDLTLRANLSSEQVAKIHEEFGGEFVTPNNLRVATLPEGFTDFPSWKEGQLWVQDLAASVPAQVLGVKESEEVLDMCAAPGGKTMQLAANGANVTAIDLNEDRLKLVAENLARTNLSARLLAGDAKKIMGAQLLEGVKYDAILLDAPCSATGTIRRNLESLWIKTPYDLPKLIEIQCELIRAAAASLKSGGRLVYAVCSLEPEEGDLAFASALEAGLKPLPITAAQIPALGDSAKDAIEQRGSLRIMPYMRNEIGGMDGFFIARFVKP